MGMQDVRSGLVDHLVEATAGRQHLGDLADHRNLLAGGGWLGGPIEGPAVDLVHGAIEAVLLRRRYLHGVPATLSLGRKDADGAKAVSALQRRRMVKKVQYFHNRLSIGHGKRQPSLTIVLPLPTSKFLHSRRWGVSAGPRLPA